MASDNNSSYFTIAFIQTIVLMSIAITQAKTFYNDNIKLKFNDDDQAKFYYWAVKLPTASICVYAGTPLFVVLYAAIRYMLCDLKNKSPLFSKSITSVYLSSGLIGTIMLLACTGMITYKQSTLDCVYYQVCGESFMTLYTVAFWFMLSGIIIAVGLGLFVCFSGCAIVWCLNCFGSKDNSQSTPGRTLGTENV